MSRTCPFLWKCPRDLFGPSSPNFGSLRVDGAFSWYAICIDLSIGIHLAYFIPGAMWWKSSASGKLNKQFRSRDAFLKPLLRPCGSLGLTSETRSTPFSDLEESQSLFFPLVFVACGCTSFQAASSCRVKGRCVASFGVKVKEILVTRNLNV